MATTELVSLSCLIGGTQRAADLRGQMMMRQEQSASAVCRLHLALPSGATLDPDGYEGLSVLITCAWAGHANPDTWFRGTVATVEVDDATARLILTCTDGLQTYMEARDEATVDAAITGSQRHPSIQSARQDGWRQALDCLKTVRAGYAIGRDGVHRLIPWALGATPTHTLTGADYYGEQVRRSRMPAGRRRNVVRWVIQVRAPILSQIDFDGGCAGPAVDAQSYEANPYDLVPVESMVSAIEGGGTVYRPSGTLGGGSSAGHGIRLHYITGQDQARCTGAGWTWRERWSQTVTLTYALVVWAPDSAEDWGPGIDERTASIDDESAVEGWDGSVSGSHPSIGEALSAAGGVTRWLALDADDLEAALESALAEAAATIYADHLQEVEVPCFPDAVAAIDLYHQVAIDSPGLETEGRVYAIESTLDLDTWAMTTTLTLRVSRCPGPGGTDDALLAPTRPAIPAGYSLSSTQQFPFRIGGQADTLNVAYDGDWQGVTTMYTTNLVANHQVYPYRAAFGAPEIPAAAQDALEVGGYAIYAVYPPNDSLEQIAP